MDEQCKECSRKRVGASMWCSRACEEETYKRLDAPDHPSDPHQWDDDDAAPIFATGESVCDLDGERSGIVERVGEIDPVAGRRYLVREKATNAAKWRNEDALRRAQID